MAVFCFAWYTKQMLPLKKLFRNIRARRFAYEPLVKVMLSKNALLHNLHIFERRCAPARIAPVLKSNAYGHGLLTIARELDKQKPVFLVVDSYYEALMIKNEGIASEVLIIGYTRPEIIQSAKQAGIIFTIVSFDQLKEVAKNITRSTRIHIKIDTGMHRQGIPVDKITEAITILQKNRNIHVEGICSHLADADVKNSQYTELQITAWNDVYKTFSTVFSTIKYAHVEATAGTRYAGKVMMNVARIGLGLYGIDSYEEPNTALHPVLSMESIVVGIKELNKGEGVGYNQTFHAPTNMKIGIVPVGYFEGIPRALSNRGVVSVKNKACPIIGRVSMNMMSIDVLGVDDIAEGDMVEVISNQREHKNSVESIANLCNVIPYEILVRIPEKIRRVWK